MADELAAALQAIRERDQAVWDSRANDGSLPAIEQARNDVPRLLTGYEELLNLHTPAQASGWPTALCVTCRDGHGEPVEWPCPTAEIISRALSAEGQ